MLYSNFVAAEHLRIGLERDARAGAGGAADAADVAGRHAALIFLLIKMPVAADFDFAPFGKKVDHFHADAVQPAGGFVGLLVEFAAELEHRHHALQRRDAEIGMDFDRDAAAIVGDRDRAVAVDGDVDIVGMAGHRFVDRVVDGFVDQVVQAAAAGVADVHAGAFADVLQVGQILHLIDAVFAGMFGAVIGMSGF